MAKVINIRERVVAELEKVMELAREGRLTCFVLAGKTTDGEVVTSWGNASLVVRQELISHLQVDVITGLLELRAEELTDE